MSTVAARRAPGHIWFREDARASLRWLLLQQLATAAILPPLYSSLSARAAGSRALRIRWARIGTRRTHRVRRRCSPWTLGSSPRRPPLELAVTRRRLISRAGKQPRSVAAMGAGCVHRSRSRHVAVLSPWWARTCFPCCSVRCSPSSPLLQSVAASPRSAALALVSASSPDAAHRCFDTGSHHPRGRLR